MGDFSNSTRFGVFEIHRFGPIKFWLDLGQIQSNKEFLDFPPQIQIHKSKSMASKQITKGFGEPTTCIYKGLLRSTRLDEPHYVKLSPLGVKAMPTKS